MYSATIWSSGADDSFVSLARQFKQALLGYKSLLAETGLCISIGTWNITIEAASEKEFAVIDGVKCRRVACVATDADLEMEHFNDYMLVMEKVSGVSSIVVLDDASGMAI